MSSAIVPDNGCGFVMFLPHWHVQLNENSPTLELVHDHPWNSRQSDGNSTLPFLYLREVLQGFYTSREVKKCPVGNAKSCLCFNQLTLLPWDHASQPRQQMYGNKWNYLSHLSKQKLNIEITWNKQFHISFKELNQKCSIVTTQTHLN